MKLKIKSQQVQYTYIGFEEKVAEKLKKAKPKEMTMSEFITSLLSPREYKK